ncbi:hypothetical protein Tco_0080759, partial [Tanacetum coccineum]
RGTTNVPHLLAQYLFRHAEGRKSGDRLSGVHFIGRLAMHFVLVGDEGLRGLQQAAMAGAHEADKAGSVAEEGTQEILAPAGTSTTSTRSPASDYVTEDQQDRGDVASFTTEQTRVSTWLISCMTQLMDASGHTYQAFNSTLVGSSRMTY